MTYKTATPELYTFLSAATGDQVLVVMSYPADLAGVGQLPHSNLQYNVLKLSSYLDVVSSLRHVGQFLQCNALHPSDPGLGFIPSACNHHSYNWH